MARSDEKATAAPAVPARPAAAGRAVLGLACAAQFMVVLDVSVVNVALPSIRSELGFDAAGLPWIANAYALAFGGFLLLGGRLADLYGRRGVFLLGLALFSASSLVGGLASMPGTLIAARAAQGLGAAVLAPATLTILTTAFPEGTRRTRALAVWTAVSLVGGASGNLVGGVLTHALSWRWILLINVPIGAVAVLAAARHLAGRRYRQRRAGRLDIAGAATATAGLASLTFGIAQTETHGWASPATLTALSSAAALLIGFVAIEARASVPLIPQPLLRARSIYAGNTVMLLAGACFQVPMWYFLTLYMQNVLHYSALEAGLGFLPHTLLTMLVGLQLTPRLMRRLDDRVLVLAGALVAATGFAWQSRITADGDYVTAILGPAILISIGGGLLNTPLTTTVTAGVARSDAGAASGLMNTAKQVGGALGLAVIVALIPARSGTPADLADGYGRAFLAMAAALVIVAAGSLVLPARRDD